MHSQSTGVSWRARALPGHVVAGRPVLALAPLLTAVSVGGGFAVGLAAPAPVARRADAGPGDGVTQRGVLTLAAAAAVGAPVAAVTGWRGRGRERAGEG